MGQVGRDHLAPMAAVMLKALMQNAEGKPSGVLLGLTLANVERLSDGHPIVISAAQLAELQAPGQLPIVIILGRDEQSLARQLQEGGMIQPGTTRMLRSM